MNWLKLREYAPSVVRYAIGIVFFLLGLDQLIKPGLWLAYFPSNGMFGLTVQQLVLFNGIFDLLLGILLILGIFVRFFSALSVLHLLGVIFTLGYNDISVRDFGLLLAALSVFFFGTDKLCLERIWKK